MLPPNPEETTTMRYMILISGNDDGELCAPAGQEAELYAAFDKYTQDLQKAGVLLTGEALLPADRGARVKVRDGKRIVTDGPFAEAKEVIGGYYLIQVKSKEEAIEWASRCPGALDGTIEVREVMEFPAS
jgi:hypothetical protein